MEATYIGVRAGGLGDAAGAAAPLPSPPPRDFPGANIQHSNFEQKTANSRVRALDTSIRFAMYDRIPSYI